MSATISTPIAAAPQKQRWYRRLPVLRQLRQSIGLQRGMLVAGLVITGFFVLVAIFAPVLAPYGYCRPVQGIRSAPRSADTTCCRG